VAVLRKFQHLAFLASVAWHLGPWMPGRRGLACVPVTRGVWWGNFFEGDCSVA
jgi:hypothetical protein